MLCPAGCFGLGLKFLTPGFDLPAAYRRKRWVPQPEICAPLIEDLAPCCELKQKRRAHV